jgi:parallel beta-helix repeat protein
MFHFPAQAQSGSRVSKVLDEMPSSITLRVDGIYKAPLSLRISGVTLDCDGAIVDASGGRADDAKKREREAIEIDSSSHNSIINNVFRQNSAGGIFVYKNCWERHRDPKQAPRWMHSSFSLIQGNQLEEKVGVRIACG